MGEDQMSKRKASTKTHFDSDPARGNVRDPEQTNNELERHDHPPHPDDAKERGVIPPHKPHAK